MNNDRYYLGQDFGVGVAKWLGLDPSRVDAKLGVNTEINTPLTVTLSIHIGPKDLEAIAAGMGGRYE